MSLAVVNKWKANNNTPVRVSKEDFDKYREVQNSGQFNMLDMGAEEATGLSHRTYLTCIQFYKELTKIHGPYGAD